MITTALIPVFTGDNYTQLCNARDLHAFLGVRKDFATWIKDRIAKYEFVEREDYLLTKFGEQLPSGTKYKIDYHLTLDMAKELAMVENNEQGRKVRRYFIQAENELRSHLRDMAQHVLPLPGVTSRARDGLKFKDALVLQVHSRNTMRSLLDATNDAERYNLHCLLRQVNDLLGIPTQSLEDIEDSELDLSLGAEKLGEQLLERILGKHGLSSSGKGE